MKKFFMWCFFFLVLTFTPSIFGSIAVSFYYVDPSFFNPLNWSEGAKFVQIIWSAGMLILTFFVAITN